MQRYGHEKQLKTWIFGVFLNERATARRRLAAQARATDKPSRPAAPELVRALSSRGLVCVSARWPFPGRKLEPPTAHSLATTGSRLGAKLVPASAAAWRRCRQRPRERRKKQAVSPSLDSEPLPPTPRERDGALSWPEIGAADNLTVAESRGLVRCKIVYFVNLQCKSPSAQQTIAEMY